MVNLITVHKPDKCKPEILGKDGHEPNISYFDFSHMSILFRSTQDNTEKIEKPKKYNSSRIRDHLANERTYLAWMRTAIALMGFGVLILRLRAFHPPLVVRSGYGWKLGLLFSVVGLLTVLLSTQHYFCVRHDIDEDTYEPGDRWVILFSIAVTLLGTGIIYFVTTSSLIFAELMVAE